MRLTESTFNSKSRMRMMMKTKATMNTMKRKRMMKEKGSKLRITKKVAEISKGIKIHTSICWKSTLIGYKGS